MPSEHEGNFYNTLILHIYLRQCNWPADCKSIGGYPEVPPVPSIASQVNQVNAALKPPAQQPPLPAPDRASAAPFDSLLADNTPPATAPEPAARPAPDDKPEPSPRAQADAKAPPAKDNKPAKEAKNIKSDSGKAEKTGKADKLGKADATDDSKTADAKSEAKTDIQTAAETLLVTPDAAQVTNTTPATAAVPVATAVASVAAIPIEGANPDGAAKTSVAVAATQLAATVTVSTPGATKVAMAPADKTGTKDKLDPTAPRANADTVGDATKATAKPTTPAQTDGKPAADDKQATPVHTEHAATADAVAPKPQDAAVKPATDLVQPPAMSAPAQHAAAADAAAPAPQVAAQPASQPVSLVGVPLEIAGKALAGKNHFEIRLDPPELGRIEVRLDVGRDGSISSHVIADRKDTLDLLQRDGASLQRAFEDAGLKTSDQSLQFSLRDHSAGREQSAPAADTAQLIVEDEIALDPLPIYNRLASARGGLDIRV
jgi:flagellar hook-length control protein FliK